MKKTEQYIRLSELAAIVDDLIAGAFYNQSYWIIAETSDVKNYADRGYCFLSLIERDAGETLAKMEAVIWSRYYHIISEFEIAAGITFDKNVKVLVKVMIDFSPVYGLKLQIINIEPSFTTGELEKERQDVLRRLVLQNPELVSVVDGNYLTQNKRLVRPMVIQKIALITAPDSDGQKDFLHELQSNAYAYQFFIDQYLCRIQGVGAEKEISAKLEEIKKSQIPYNIVVILRGGGGQLDFGPFDTYDLSLAVAGFPLPVITGIGHARNVSITDLMSHLYVKTPTKAAAFIIEHNRKFETDLVEMGSYLLDLASAAFEAEKTELDRLISKFTLVCSLFLNNKRTDLEMMNLTLRHLDPENVLKRGFAMLLKNNEIIVDPRLIEPGDQLEIRLKEYSISTLVQHKTRK